VTKNDYKLLQLCSKAFPLVVFLVVLPLGSFLVVRRGSDPIYCFAKHLHGVTDETIDSHYGVLFVRFLMTWWFCSELCMCFPVYFSLSMILCKSLNDCLVALKCNCSLLPNVGVRKSIVLSRNAETQKIAMKVGNTLRLSVKLYNMIRIHINQCCGAGTFVYYQNFLLLFGSIGLTGLCNYTFIRLQANLGLSMRLASPSISLSSLFTSNSLVPEIIRVHEESKEFVRTVKRNVRNKYDWKLCASLNSTGFSAGSFFVYKKSTRPNFTKLLVDSSVTLLLSF